MWSFFSIIIYTVAKQIHGYKSRAQTNLEKQAFWLLSWNTRKIRKNMGKMRENRDFFNVFGTSFKKKHAIKWNVLLHLILHVRFFKWFHIRALTRKLQLELSGPNWESEHSEHLRISMPVLAGPNVAGGSWDDTLPCLFSHTSLTSIIFRAFLLPENSSKNWILNWVLKRNLDQQVF